MCVGGGGGLKARGTELSVNTNQTLQRGAAELAQLESQDSNTTHRKRHHSLSLHLSFSLRLYLSLSLSPTKFLRRFQTVSESRELPAIMRHVPKRAIRVGDPGSVSRSLNQVTAEPGVATFDGGALYMHEIQVQISLHEQEAYAREIILIF